MRLITPLALVLGLFQLEAAATIDLQLLKEMVATLEQKVENLEARVSTQQKQIAACCLELDREPAYELKQRLSVSLAIPCIPRHVNLLRQVLGDVRNQTVFPDQVVVSLSQTSKEEGARLEISLKEELFSGPLPNTARHHQLQFSGKKAVASATFESLTWPTLRILTTLDPKTHSENRNLAAASCHGDIVSWFDADDRMHPRRIEVLERAFRELKVAAVLHSFEWGRESAPPIGHASIAFVRRALSDLSAHPTSPSQDTTEISVVMGDEMFDVYAATEGGLDSLEPPDPDFPIVPIQHGHISVDRRKVLQSSSSGASVHQSNTCSEGSSSGDGGRVSAGLQWENVPAKGGAGGAVGEDIRFVKAVLKKFGRENETMTLLGAMLSTYQPSWSHSRRCVIGQRVLYDCHVSADPVTGETKVDFGGHTVATCPEGTQPGLDVEESTRAESLVGCVTPAERETLAPGVVYLDDFEATESGNP